MKDWVEIDTTNWKNIMNKVTSKREKEDESKSFTDFLNEAEVILVDNAFTFDINKWEKENQEEIDEELSEAKNNISNVTNSHFIKYQLAPDRVKEIVNKIINSDFNIVNYWKTNQFKKKNNLTDDDLKDILRTLTEQDYKTNSISIDNSKNEIVIFIKNTNLKNIKNVKLYIKIDYDSIENSPVIVISFHNVHKKSTLTSSYNNIKKVNDNGYSNSKLLEDLYDDWTIDDEDDIENYEEDNPITPEQKAFGEELKEFFQSLIDEELEDEDLEEISPYTNIKSNGIYSLNTGWVKHPVQQDIPDIDMEEFEKEFKVWEDKYFDLLDELDESEGEDMMKKDKELIENVQDDTLTSLDKEDEFIYNAIKNVNENNLIDIPNGDLSILLKD